MFQEMHTASPPQFPATSLRPLESVSRPAPGESDQTTETVVVTSAASLAPEEVRWLWKDHLPKGKVTLFVGPDGVGKSLIALDLVSRVTSGRHWPGQNPAEDPPLAEVVVVCQPYEVDDLGIRLRNLGADMDLVHLFQGIKCKDTGFPEEVRFCQLPEDLDRLEEVLAPLKNLELLVIDPLWDFCRGKRNVAETLQQLEALAARHNVAVVVVDRTAVRRDRRGDVLPPADRTYGFTRCVWTIAPDEDLEGRGEFLPSRLNCASRPEGYGFRIDDDGKFCWEPLGRAKRRSDVELAMDWLKMALGDGKLPMKSMRECAAEFGIKYGTLRRAADRLGVIARKTGYGPFGEWIWSLPEQKVESTAAASTAASDAASGAAPSVADTGATPSAAPTVPPGTPDELKQLSRGDPARHGSVPARNGSNGYETAIARQASDPPPVRRALRQAPPASPTPPKPAMKPDPDGSAAPKRARDPAGAPANGEIVAHLKEPGGAARY